MRLPDTLPERQGRSTGLKTPTLSQKFPVTGFQRKDQQRQIHGEPIPKDRLLGVVLNQSDAVLSESHYNYGYYNYKRLGESVGP